MNSLSELNGFNQSLSLTFTDNRLADVKFNLLSPINQTVITNEGSTFASAVGIEINEVINYEITQVSYTINISAVDGIDLSWGTLPEGCTIENTTTGIYTIYGITDNTIWDLIKSPTIILPAGLPNAYYGNFVYSATINYYSLITGTSSKTWTVAVSVLDVTLLSNPLEFTYLKDSSNNVLYTPQLEEFALAEYAGAIWTITGTPSSTLPVSSFSSSYSDGGTFTYNSSPKTFTIVGTQEQINLHLSSLVFVSNTVSVDFVLYYQATNDQDDAVDTKYQNFISQDIQFLSNTTPSYYTEDRDSAITGYPVIADVAYTGSDDYILTITPTITSAITRLYAAIRDQKTITTVGYPSILAPVITNPSIQPLVDDTPIYIDGTVAGSGNYLRLGGQSPIYSDMKFANYDQYTIETWVYHKNWQQADSPATGQASSSIWSIGRNEVGRTSTSFGFNKNGQITLNWSQDTGGYGGGGTIQESTPSGILNKWQHIAMVKNGNTTKLYVDGLLKASGTINTYAPRYDNLGHDISPLLGAGYYGGKLYLNRFRMSRTARYNTEFDPPTGILANDRYTVILINSWGIEGDNEFEDDITSWYSGGTEEWDSETSTLTLTGSKSEVQGRLEYLRLIPSTDYASSFSLNYFLTTPESNTANKLQTMLVGSSDNEVTNMQLTRSYVSNNSNYIFASNNPIISDFDEIGNDSYTIVLNCAWGQWGLSTYDLVNPYSFSGTRTQVNNHFASIKFYPNANVSTNGTFTYQQYKNTILQITVSVQLEGTVGTYSGARDIDWIAGGTFTPTALDVMYGKISDLLIVGGGGGGGFGGGGGGQVKEIFNINLSNETYTISIGQGGSAGVNASGADGNTTSAFGFTALGGKGGGAGSDATSRIGGGSYDSTGTLYAGGNGADGIYYNSSTLFKGSGGGAGSGGGPKGSTPWPPTKGGRQTRHDGERVRFPTFASAYPNNGIDAYDPPGNSGTTYPWVPSSGNGGYGAVLSGYFKRPAGYAGYYGQINSNYGFGGAGGLWGDRSGPGAEPSGVWSLDPDGAERVWASGNASIGAVGSTQQYHAPTDWDTLAISTQFDGLPIAQVPEFAGGGGGGSSPVHYLTAPASPGLRGVVRIRITSK